MTVTAVLSDRRYKHAVKRFGEFGTRYYTTIYAISAPELGRIKFGMTKDIGKRFASLQTASPAELTLLGHVWMPHDAEAEIFEFLKDDRLHGEWFMATNRVREVAALISAKMAVQIAEAIGMKCISSRESNPVDRIAVP
jgi:hypothetical protein